MAAEAQAQQLIDRLENRLTAMQEAGVAVGPLVGQLSLAHGLLAHGDAAAAADLAEALLSLATRAASGRESDEQVAASAQLLQAQFAGAESTPATQASTAQPEPIASSDDQQQPDTNPESDEFPPEDAQAHKTGAQSATASTALQPHRASHEPDTGATAMQQRRVQTQRHSQGGHSVNEALTAFERRLEALQDTFSHGVQQLTQAQRGPDVDIMAEALTRSLSQWQPSQPVDPVDPAEIAAATAAHLHQHLQPLIEQLVSLQEQWRSGQDDLLQQLQGMREQVVHSGIATAHKGPSNVAEEAAPAVAEETSATWEDEQVTVADHEAIGNDTESHPVQEMTPLAAGESASEAPEAAAWDDHSATETDLAALDQAPEADPVDTAQVASESAAPHTSATDQSDSSTIGAHTEPPESSAEPTESAIAEDADGEAEAPSEPATSGPQVVTPAHQQGLTEALQAAMHNADTDAQPESLTAAIAAAVNPSADTVAEPASESATRSLAAEEDAGTADEAIAALLDDLPAASAPASPAATSASTPSTADLRQALSDHLIALLDEPAVRQKLFAVLAMEAAVNPSALGELTGIRAFLRREVERVAAEQASPAPQY